MFLRKTILFSIILLTLQSIYSEDIEQLLTQKTGWWGPGGGASNWAWGYKFKKNGKVKYIFAGEGSHQVDGTYKIDGEEIKISLNKPTDDFKIPLKNTCRIVADSESLVYRKKLLCSDKKSYFGSGHISRDELKMIENIPVVTMGRKRAKITADVKYRSQPNKGASTIECKLVQKQLKPSSSLAKESIIHVYARTKEKESIDKWSNYWYYVAPMYDMHDGESCKADFGWIFAEFTEWDTYQDN